MVNCRICSGKAAFEDLCKEHFIEQFESKVLKTIKDFDLVRKGQKIAIACSGGKDSVTVLHISNKYFGNVTAIAIDEGISGYRDKTLEDLQRICSEMKIPLKIYSFKDATGQTLDQIKTKVNTKPCTPCGIMRRYLLNKAAKEYDVLVTGHNMDDEVQSLVMNIAKGNMELSARLGPKSGIIEDEGFIPRVKPLYLCTEKETTAYAFLMGFDIKFSECPNSYISYRAKVRDALNVLETKKPGTKKALIHNFLETLPKLKGKYSASQKLMHCSSCGEPSSSLVCNACRLIQEISA